MRVTVERMPGSTVEVDIFADDAEFATAVDKAFRKIAKEVTIPGFRRGKAPRHIIENLIGRDAIVEEAGRDIMDDLYRRALEQENLIPVSDPRVGILQAEPIGFKVVVEVYPTVELGDYRSIRVEPREVDIEEGEVEEVLDGLRKRHAAFEELETPRMPTEGDQVIVDYQVFEGDEPFQEPVNDAAFIIGESPIFDALNEAIKMMMPGSTADVTLAFDEDDETVAPDLRGKELRYQITLKDVKKRVLPELDDEFAKQVGEFESMEALQEQIRKDLLRNKATQTRNEVVTDVINHMAEVATVEIPTAMIEKEIDDEITQFRSRLAQQRLTLEEYLEANRQTMDDLREELRPNAERRVRNSLVLQEIAKAEQLEVTPEDIAAEIDKLTAGSQNPERLRTLYESDHFRGLLESEVYDRKLTNLVVDIATEGQGAITGPGAEALKEEPANQTTGETAAEANETEAEAVVSEVSIGETMAEADEQAFDADDVTPEQTAAGADGGEVSSEAAAAADAISEAEPDQPTTAEPPAEPAAAVESDAEDTRSA